MGGIFRKIKRRLGKTQKWVMGEKIVFDEGKQRVKQQENVDIQRKLPLPMYIDDRGNKKSVMNHFYYTMKIYIGSYPSEIIGREMLEIADEISSILGCTYEK